MKRKIAMILALVLCLCSVIPVTAYAATPDPWVMVKSETDKGFYTYTYDTEGRCIQKIHYDKNKFDGTSKVTSTVYYSYNTNSQLSHTRTYLTDSLGQEQLYEELVYDEYGTLTASYEYNRGKITRSYRSTPEYDRFGRLISNTILGPYDKDDKLAVGYEEEQFRYEYPTVPSTVFYGHYEQDGNTANGAEPIEWIVLGAEGNNLLLISKYALDSRVYHSKNMDVEWKDSDLRTWLNSDFMEQAFSYPEYCQLRYGTQENGLYDQVFVLSQKEVERFFPTEEERICLPTKYAIKKGAYVNKTTGGSWWFLRTPGNDPACVMSVNSDGVMDYDGGKVTLKKGTVRPVIWVDKTVMAGNYHPLREHYNYASYTSPGITDITRSHLTTFNDAGIRTHMRVEENYENEIMNSNEYMYDDYGNPTFIRYAMSFRYSDVSDIHIYTYENTYDKAGHMTKHTVYYDDDLECQAQFRYDKAGRMIYRNDPCEGYDEESWTYDQYGNLLTYSYRGKLKETYTYARLSTASLSVD